MAVITITVRPKKVVGSTTVEYFNALSVLMSYNATAVTSAHTVDMWYLIILRRFAQAKPIRSRGLPQNVGITTHCTNECQ